MRVLSVAATVAMVAASQCVMKSQCAFQEVIAKTTYSWDFSSLCLEKGQYTYNASTRATFYFNICGNAEQVCSPMYPLFLSVGSVVQMFGTPECTEKTCTNYQTGEENG